MTLPIVPVQVTLQQECNTCPGKTKSLSFADKRQAKCNNCQESVGDICLIIEAKHPGKSSISHGVVRPELRCPKATPEWIEEPMQCPHCRRVNQIIPVGQGVCNFCVLRKNITGKLISRSVRSFNVPVSRGVANKGSSFRVTGEAQWVSLQQMTLDVQALASMLPDDISAVVGVARSGMAAASILSMLLHRPLFAIRQTKKDVIAVGNGWRLGSGADHVEPAAGRAVIVDDTVMTGNSFKDIASIIKTQFPDAIRAALYVNPLAKLKPDLWVHDLGWPHLLEWNLFNSVLSPNIACDFDGVLCHDCPPGSDDDGARYLDFIRNAKPLHLPRKTPIPLIVTARIEKYRDATEAWLRRHGVRFHSLVMHPAATLAERQRDDIAAFKARHFEAWASRHIAKPSPLMFIESEDRQARSIASITGRMVVCPATESVYT